MSSESFENFDYSGFSGVFNINDLNPVKEDISDRVVEKKDMSGEKKSVGGPYSFIRGIGKELCERQEDEARKLNPAKYKKEKMAKKLNQIKGTLREKQKDLVTMKAKYDRLMNKVVLSKEEQKSLNTLDIEIDYLQWEIVDLKRDKRDIEIKMDSFSYGYYDAKSRENAGYNMDHQKFGYGTPNHVENSEKRISELECIYKWLKPYLEKNPDAFRQDYQQGGRDDRSSL